MKYACFDTNGVPVAFYSDDVHGPRKFIEQEHIGFDDISGESVFREVVTENPNTQIPTEAVEITEDQWIAFISNSGKLRFDNGNLVEISYTLEEVRVQKLKELADYRYMIEVGGILINGITIYTDPISQSKLTGAWVKMQMTPNKTINWKGENGWVKTTKSDIEAIAVAVADHVQTCFDMEYQHSQLINSIEDVELLSAYDVKTGWPTNALGVING